MYEKEDSIMIVDSFDDKSEAKINPKIRENRMKCDVCIIIFSYIIEQYILENFDCKKVGELKSVTLLNPVYSFEYKGRKIIFYKTHVGAPATVGFIEDITEQFDVKDFVLFGGSGCLDKEIAHGKVIVPTEAYRDEGTSYHYVKPADYIKIKNSDVVANFMKENNIPYIEGKTWTTDAFFRETINNFNKRKAEGCISVEMESAAAQAVCDFRGLNLYCFFTSGDLLDAPVWDDRKKNEELAGTQHDASHFDIALELAVSLKKE
jgi:uridine phosphorylase